MNPKVVPHQVSISVTVPHTITGIQLPGDPPGLAPDITTESIVDVAISSPQHAAYALNAAAVAVDSALRGLGLHPNNTDTEEDPPRNLNGDDVRKVQEP